MEEKAYAQVSFMLFGWVCVLKGLNGDRYRSTLTCIYVWLAVAVYRRHVADVHEGYACRFICGHTYTCM